MKRLMAIISFSILCLLLVSCGSATGNDTNQSDTDKSEQNQITEDSTLENLEENQEEFENEIKHTADHVTLEGPFSANYMECVGGYKQDYYWCIDCERAFDEEENLVEPIVGTGVHKRSEKPNECYLFYLDGELVDGYTCKVCGTWLDAEGSYLTAFDEKVDAHHAIQRDKINRDAPCGGGFLTDYVCEKCGEYVDEEGKNVEYVAGTGAHVADLSTKTEPNYVECIGGFVEEFYDCKACGDFVDKDGNEIVWVEGTNIHTPYLESLYPPEDPAVIAEYGGYIEEHYNCIYCSQGCREDGSKAEWVDGE